MPINEKYKFVNKDADMFGGNAFRAGMGLWGGPQEDSARATPPIPGGLSDFDIEAVNAARQQPQRATPYQSPRLLPEEIDAALRQSMASQAARPFQQQMPQESFEPATFDMPSEPPGMAARSQMTEQDLPPEQMQSEPSIPQNYDRTTLAKKAQEMGFDPRQLFVAMAEFGSQVGNLQGKPTHSTARGFYEMQKKYEQQDLDNKMRQQRMEQQPLIKPIDPLNQEYKQLQMDYLRNKMNKPAPEVDPLKIEQQQANIDLTRARQKKIETTDAQLPGTVNADGEGYGTMSPKAIQLASSLRKEYQNNAVTKITRDVKSQWEKVKTVMDNPSAAGDMAAIFMFMKTLDPGSTVREGEYKSAAEATSAMGRMQTYANNVQSGQKLNPQQRMDFKKTMERFYRAQIKEQERVNRDYRDLAVRSGVNARDLMIEAVDDTPAETQATGARGFKVWKP